MIFGLNLPNYSRLGIREAIIAIAERAEVRPSRATCTTSSNNLSASPKK